MVGKREKYDSRQPSYWWQDKSYDDIMAHAKEKCDIAILPIGSIEMHGSHCPTGHDTYQLFPMLEKVAERTDALLLPPLWYGGHPHHHWGFPGTIPLQNNTLNEMLKDIVRGVKVAGINKVIQGDPFREDTDSIVRYAEYNASASPNIMAKIPVTKDGLDAIEYVARKGIAINATEVMSVRQALDVCERYVHATNDMAAPAPIYFSHITGILDEYLRNTVKAQGIDISPDVLWQAGIAAAKKTYWMVKEKNYPVGFIGGGARGLHHFTEMVGADASITINWAGTADALLAQDMPVVQRFLAPTPYSVIDELTEKLPDFRKAYYANAISADEYEDFGPVVLFRSSFEKAWSSALDIIRQRRSELSAGQK